MTESTEGSVDELAVGDNVSVLGETTDAGATAQRVVDSGDLAIATGSG